KILCTGSVSKSVVHRSQSAVYVGPAGLSLDSAHDRVRVRSPSKTFSRSHGSFAERGVGLCPKLHAGAATLDASKCVAIDGEGVYPRAAAFRRKRIPIMGRD